MADDIVTRDVTDPWQEICDLRDEIERLQRWKMEACSVLADWDALYVDLGDRGELGQRKSAVVAAEIKRLRAEAAEEILRLRSALALAVGELSTHSEYRVWSPEMLMNQFLEEARRG